jgi:hypothetical protein
MDLFLIEEFVSSPEFFLWFCAEAGIPAPNVDEETVVRHSTSTGNGESDIEVAIRLTDGQKAIILIENKVNAGLQPRQAERYRERAANYIGQGLASIVSTVLVAPSAYIGVQGKTKGFDRAITYEAIRDRVQVTGAVVSRQQYKSLLLEAAIQKGILGYSPVIDAPVTKFWRDYWQLVLTAEPALNLREPLGKPSSSTFVTFSPPGFPSLLSLLHKLPDGKVDLQFGRWGYRLGELNAATESFRESDMVIGGANKSGAIRIKVPPVDVSRPLDCQRSDALIGIQAAGRLLRWYRKYEYHLRTLAESVAGPTKTTNFPTTSS